MNGTNGTTPHEAQFVDDKREPDDDDEPIEPIALPSRKEIDAAMDKARAVIAPALEMTFLAVSFFATGKLAWEAAKRKAAKRAREARDTTTRGRK